MELKVNITEEEVKNVVLGSDKLQHVVAGQVNAILKDSIYDEIKNEYQKIFREELRAVVKEYVEEYYKAHTIKRDIEKALESMTKAEVVAYLSGRNEN